MNRTLKHLLCAIAVLGAQVSVAEPDMFPFVISYDAPDNVVNMSHLLDAPAGKYGHIRVQGDQFVNDRGPVRFNATNLTGAANFPTHQEADRLADRLARFGFNCVRLHYFDSAYGNFMQPQEQGIIALNKNTQRQLDHEQRDRQDYLIAALKKRGIYVNINLHVARHLSEADGVPKGTPWANKGVDAFDPRIIELEKEYARDLLTHVNPYTGLSYAEDPCVALVELNNEDAIFNQYFHHGLDHLGKPHADTLRKLWNQWLRKKYTSSQNLFKSWNITPTPLGEEMIPDGTFAQPVAVDGTIWRFEAKRGAEATARHEGNVLKLTVKKSGEDHQPKLHRRVAVKKGHPYTVSFRIRRSGGAGLSELGFGVADTVNGWRGLGIIRRFRLGSKWLNITQSFYALHDSNEATIQFTRFSPGEYELELLSFKPGTNAPSYDSFAIEKEQMPIIRNADCPPPPIYRDFIQFLVDTERAYWTGMRDYLVHELKVKAPISGTQMGYSPAYVQADLDYIDHHAYWCHPEPVNPHWTIRNASMSRSLGGCINGLANIRVAGKPFTVSEYNHPYPNFYGAEGQLMLRAYGALQDWNGVFQYTYNHRKLAEPDSINYFFSTIARTDVLAHFPACAAIYLRRDVKTSDQTLVAPLAEADYFDKMCNSKSIVQGTNAAGLHYAQGLVQKIALDISGKSPAPHGAKPVTAPRVTSDTGELTWNTDQGKNAVWTVDTPQTKVLSGFMDGRSVTLGDVTFSIGKTRLGWATLSLMSHDATGFGQHGRPARLLLAATGLTHNTGAKFTDLTGNKIACRGQDWGKGPVLCEGIPATILLPAPADKTTCYALDNAGNRTRKLNVANQDGKALITIAPEFKTVWYEIEVK